MKIESVIWWGILAAVHLVGCAPDLKTTAAGGAGGVGETGGAGGSGGETASSSGGIPGPEACDDGFDNDGDTFIDCADAQDCEKLYSCNPAVPAGWTYVRIRRPSYGTPPVLCTDGSEPTRFFLEPTKSACTPCNCQAAGNCSGSITCYLQSGCLNLSGTRTYSTKGQCVSLTNGVPLKSCTIEGTGQVPMAATCSATGGVLSEPDPFLKEFHVCPAESDAAGCGEQTCVEKAKSPYENRLCVMKVGDSACPAGFNEVFSIFRSYMDTRTCTPCACDDTQIKCSGSTTLELWGDPMCTTNGQLVSSATGCVNLTSNPTDISIIDLPGLSVPKAACTGGVPTGASVGTDPTTICCGKP